MHVIMPYLFGGRTANEAVLCETLDLTEIDKYLEKKNSSNPEFKYTWFHVITAILAKTILLRPRMNWFIKGGRFYEHKQVQLGFNVKRKFSDDAVEAIAKFILDPEGGSPLEQVHDYVQSFVSKVRNSDTPVGVDKAMYYFSRLPRPILSFSFWILKKLDYFGIYPQSLAKDDPCFSSCYISNLGSIKMSADYHHLFDWGTLSLFVVINEKKLIPVFKEDGSFEMRNSLSIGFTLDERIADGYYFAKTMRIVRKLAANPELLDLPAATPVEIDN